MKFKHSSVPVILFTISVILFLPLSCKKNSRITNLELPPTSILQIQSSWAIITSSHLRLRQEPKTDSPVVTTLWKGNILELLMKSTSEDTVEDETDYWYKISYGGLTGWVFGHYLLFFSSKDDAIRAATAAEGSGEEGTSAETSPDEDLP